MCFLIQPSSRRLELTCTGVEIGIALVVTLSERVHNPIDLLRFARKNECHQIASSGKHCVCVCEDEKRWRGKIPERFDDVSGKEVMQMTEVFENFNVEIISTETRERDLELNRQR